MYKKALRFLLPAALVAPAFAAEWMTDLPAAQAKAAAEDKAVLVDFTGSDWCGWCIKLRQNVLDKPEFEAYAKDKFVLVEIDIPNGDKITPEQRKTNEALCKKFGISGFPTLLVLTPQGEVAGGFVGGRQNLAAVQEPLDQALKMVEELQKAQQLEGNAKLKALLAVYNSLPDGVQKSAESLREQIIAADAEDTTGFRRQQEVKAQMQAIHEEVASSGEKEKIIATLDQWLEKAYQENKSAIYLLKSNVLMYAAEVEEDLDAAEEAALKGVELMEGEKAENTRAGIQRVFANKAETLQRIKAMRDRLKQ